MCVAGVVDPEALELREQEREGGGEVEERDNRFSLESLDRWSSFHLAPTA